MKKFNTLYNTCLICILLLFFSASYALGTMIYAQSSVDSDKTSISEAVEDKKQEVEATVAEIDSTAADTAVQTDTDTAKATATPQENTRRYYDILLSEDKQDIVFDICEEYDIPAEIAFAIMNAESSYKHNVISETSDYGMMQINEVNHKWLRELLGVSDFLDFEQNIRCGVYMLSEYYHKYNEINKIAMCYRYGEYGAIELWNEGVFQTEYTKKIEQTIESLKFK